MSAIIEAPRIEVRPFEFEIERPLVEAEARAERNSVILDQIPALTTKREELAKLESEVNKLNRETLAQHERLESLNQDRERGLDQLKRAQYQADEAKEIAKALAEEIISHNFRGEHPQLGRDARPYDAICIAARIPGAEIVAKLHADWVKKHTKALTAIEAEMVKLARELGIEERLPFTISE
jgi:hypothetical protein